MGRLAWPALLTAAIVASLALAACDGAGEPPFLTETVTPVRTAPPAASPGPTPSPSPVATPAESGGLDGFRAFAAQIAAAVATGDGAFFAERGLEDEMTCDGSEELGPCAGQPGGTVLRGIPGAAAQSDAFGLFSPADYADLLADWFAAANPSLSDEYGSGAVTLYALAHRPASPGGEEAYQAIVTGIFTSGPSTLRQARILSFQFLDGSWRLTRELFATVPQTADAYLSGACAECYDDWERWEG